MKRVVDALAPAALILLLLAGWEAACRLTGVPAYFLPPPSKVMLAAASGLTVLVPAAWNTLSVALVALVLAAAAALALALLVGLSPLLERAVRPLASALQVTPVVAVAPLILIWAGIDHPERAVIALAVLVAFFPIFSGTVTGLRSADPDLERLFDLYGASRLERVLRLRLPAAVPFLMEGLKVGAGLAIIGAVVAEFAAGAAGRETGLASRILEASFRTEIPKMFAALTLVSGVGILIHVLFDTLARRWLGRWHDTELPRD
jgi:NitT/TauT family transport system permease protein